MEPTQGVADHIPRAPAPETEAITRRRMSLWSKLGTGAVVLLALAVILGFVIHVPYTTLSPGAAVSLTSLVQVEGGKTFPEPRGDIRLLYVSERDHINLWRYVQAKLDSDIDLIKDTVINPTGASQEDQTAQAVADMSQAKIAATKVALEAAGYRVSPSAQGLVVLSVFPSKPAGKVLRVNDVILNADGITIRNDTDLRNAIAKHKAGDRLALEILRDGKRERVSVAVAVVNKQPGIGVYVSPRYDFPIKVDVDTAGIQGPSGGLAMTLAILDILTPGDLTGGVRVAVTGTIDPDGNVGEIGGIEQKAVAARAAHVKLFLVPLCDKKDDTPASYTACENDLAKATRRVGKNVKVVPVATFAQALQVLRANGGAPPTQVARGA